VLVFLSVGSRRIEYVACTRKPDTAWMLQQARNAAGTRYEHQRADRSGEQHAWKSGHVTSTRIFG
jgi:hypothetical protein